MEKEEIEKLRVKAYFDKEDRSELLREDLLILWDKYPFTFLTKMSYFCVRLIDGKCYKMSMSRFQSPYVKGDKLKIIFTGEEISEEAYLSYLEKLGNMLKL